MIIMIGYETQAQQRRAKVMKEVKESEGSRIDRL